MLPTTDGHHSRGDLRMIGRAVRERWDLPPGTADVVPQVMLGIVEKCEEDRERIAAARVIVTMMGQNQADEHHADRVAQDDKHLQLDAARALAGVSQVDKIALIKRAGLGHLLPADLNPKETP